MDNTLITQDRLDTFHILEDLIPDGVIAEVGVYKGGSLKVLGQIFDDRLVLGFDTFEGLPKEQWIESEIHDIGDFNDTSLEEVQEFLADTPNVVLVKGLFPDTGQEYRTMKFALVHVDTDYYLGVKACIHWFWSRMEPGGIMVFDDYQWHDCPGVQQALEEFGEPVYELANYQAYIVKP